MAALNVATNTFINIPKPSSSSNQSLSLRNNNKFSRVSFTTSASNSGFNETVDKTSKQAQDAAEKAKGIAVDLKDSAVDTAGATGDNINESAEKAKKMAGSAADKTKEAVDGAWDATKDAAQKVQETVKDLNK